MAAYVYPAIFEPFDDGTDGYVVTFPDIPGCVTEGFSLEEAIRMAHDALYQMMASYEDSGNRPNFSASKITDLKFDREKGEFPSLISVETKDSTVVRKTVSLPKWMADGAVERHISLSKTLQSALEERLNA